MAHTLDRRQPISTAHSLAVWRLAGVTLLSLNSLGCWQEVRYEPDLSAASIQAAQSQNDDSTELLPADRETPETAGETQPTATAEKMFGKSDPEEISAEVIPEREKMAADPPSELPNVAEESTNETATLNTPLILPPQAGDAADLAAEEESEGLLDPFGEEMESDPNEPSEKESANVESLDPSAEANSLVPARTALATWQMSSKWSMAAALQAKDREWEIYGERLEAARYGAKLLGVSLPDLPVHDEGADRLSENLAFLLETAGPRLASELSKQHGADHASLAELATKTNVLLLSYTPRSTRLEPVIASIRQAAEKSGLPKSVWSELVDLLTARAEFKQVKAAIYQLHKRAAAHLSGQN